MKTIHTLKISLKLLLRHKLVFLSASTITTVLLAGVLAGEFGGRQPATLALDAGISALRLVLPLFVVLLAQELFSKELERKFYLITLSYPISRLEWLTGRLLALLLVSGVILLLSITLLAAEVSFISKGYTQSTPVSLGLPLVVVTLFISLDLIVLLSLASFLAVVASTSSFALIGTLGFMLIARSYSTVMALLASNAGLVENTEAYRTSLGILGYLLPDLGALDVRMIALYGRMDFLPSDWPLLAASALLYALGFLALTLWVFRRKQFV